MEAFHPVIDDTAMICRFCNMLTLDKDFCTNCGRELTPQKKGAILKYSLKAEVSFGETLYTVVKVLEDSANKGVYEVEDPQKNRFLVISRQKEALDETLSLNFPPIENINFLKNIERRADTTLLLYPKLAGKSLWDVVLHSKIPLDELIQIVVAVGALLKKIHENGYLFLKLDPQQIWLRENTVFLNRVDRLFGKGEKYELFPVVYGYSPPEVFGHGKWGLSEASDVFMLAMIFFFAATQIGRLEGVEQPGFSIPSIRLFQPEFPLGYDRMFQQAVQKSPEKRYPTIGDFLNGLEKSFNQAQQRGKEVYRPSQLTFSSEIHIGISKALNNPVNQDALFTQYDPGSKRGFFLVADGISSATHGTGDQASRLIAVEAANQWAAFKNLKLANDEIPDRIKLSFISTIFTKANVAVSEKLLEWFGDQPLERSATMGSTAIMAIVDGNRISIGSIGDSRAYLLANDQIEQINIEHNHQIDVLKETHSLTRSGQTEQANRLTRWIGMWDYATNLTPKDLTIDYFNFTLLNGEKLLLCSDGLPDYISSEERIVEIVKATPNIYEAAFNLVAEANKGGGGDNISLILLSSVLQE